MHNSLDAQDVACMVCMAWNVTQQVVSILMGDTGEAKCGVVFFFVGGSSKSLSSISTASGSQQPYWLYQCLPNAVRVSARPVSTSGILLVAWATNGLTRGSWGITGYIWGCYKLTTEGISSNVSGAMGLPILMPFISCRSHTLNHK